MPRKQRLASSDSLHSYCAAFQGLHGQFDRMLWCDNYGDVHIDWNALDASHSPERSKRLAKIALNSARAALELLEQEETVNTFNESL